MTAGVTIIFGGRRRSNRYLRWVSSRPAPTVRRGAVRCQTSWFIKSATPLFRLYLAGVRGSRRRRATFDRDEIASRFAPLKARTRYGVDLKARAKVSSRSRSSMQVWRCCGLRLPNCMHGAVAARRVLVGDRRCRYPSRRGMKPAETARSVMVLPGRHRRAGHRRLNGLLSTAEASVSPLPSRSVLALVKHVRGGCRLTLSTGGARASRGGAAVRLPINPLRSQE